MLGGNETYVICGAGDEGNTTRLGTHGPAYATSAGKVLVAHLQEADWPHYAPGAGAAPLTASTNLDPERFYAQLREAKKQGFAWNRRETSKEHASVATVVREPFIHHPRLAVALLMREDDIMMRDLPELERSLLALAALLERELGGRSVKRR
jgi:DNA-binding IclR family transcriptional regulator